ncbi:Demethylmenaquinone methyltransferase [Friedmanniella luteola]|uniref:Putative 4-hydroxy-4-methyl-2-oxoglutarate aldolase n=1 Tax=Friedmanniella luteola TaxID=546871 RepID=A0A1H1U5V9_9ACTN|nr:RraA family protein [Friedmanniella luteola]SDS67868.1 Demethylmenaquinone methyltransferase [Friedmanniella luteola]
MSGSDEASLLERLGRVDTTSLVDAGGASGVLPGSIRPLRPGLRFVGRAVTVEARADLMSVIEGLRSSGPGDVLVVAAGSLEHAVAGELFGTEAVRRGLAGLVVDGLCRDSRALRELGFPVFARGVAPTAFGARKPPVVQVPVRIGPVEVQPGDLVVGDDDGVVVGSVEAMAAVVERAEAIQHREDALAEQLRAGSSLFDHLDYDRHRDAVLAGEDSGLTFS